METFSECCKDKLTFHYDQVTAQLNQYVGVVNKIYVLIAGECKKSVQSIKCQAPPGYQIKVMKILEASSHNFYLPIAYINKQLQQAELDIVVMYV